MEQPRSSRKRPRSPESGSSAKHDQQDAAAAAAAAALQESGCSPRQQSHSNITRRTVASLSDLDSSDSEVDDPTDNIAPTRTSSNRAAEQSAERSAAAVQAAATAAASVPKPTMAAAAAAASTSINEYDDIDDELLAALPCDTLVAIQSLQSSCYVDATAEQQAIKKAQRKSTAPTTRAETSGRLVLQHQIYTVYDNRTAGNNNH
jgi:hypothetical protein